MKKTLVHNFKEYVKSRGHHPFTSVQSAYATDSNKYPSLETSFGAHSLRAHEQYPSLETSFGLHSNNLESVDEQVSTTPGKLVAKDQIAVHGRAAQKNIHEKNKLEKTPALNSYTSDSLDINNALHTKKATDNIKKNIKSIDSSLDSASMDHDTHVFTGLKESPAKHFKGTGTAKVHLPAYTSTSTSFDIAQNFTKGVKKEKSEAKKHTPLNVDGELASSKFSSYEHMLKIHLPAGTKAGSVKHFAKHPTENEILLHRGHNIEIHPHPTVAADGTHVWHARIISHTPDKI